MIGDPLTILSPHLIQALEGRGQLLQQEASRRFNIYFNTDHPGLTSSLIRRALSLAIDRTLICERFSLKAFH